MKTLADDAKALVDLYAGAKFLDGAEVDEAQRRAFVALLADARPAMLARLARVVVVLAEALPGLRWPHVCDEPCNTDPCPIAVHNATLDALAKMLDEEV